MECDKLEHAMPCTQISSYSVASPGRSEAESHTRRGSGLLVFGAPACCEPFNQRAPLGWLSAVIQ